MYSALKVAAGVSLFVVAACDAKDSPADAGVVLVVPSAEIPPAMASEVPSAVPPVVTPAAGKAGGTATPAAVDAGVAPLLDAGAATGQECCCEASGFPLQSVAMTDCSKTRKGQCVAKTRCAADSGAALPVAKPDAGASAPGGQTCCCATGNVKAVVGMSACTKGGAGKCVKATECK